MNGLAGEILVCLDSFKGSIESAAASAVVAAALTQSLPGADVVPFAFADGGEGTVSALAACGWSIGAATVRDAFGAPTTARFAYQDERAVIEIAEIVGLPESARTREASMDADTHGVGQMLLHVLDGGFSDITLALGGSSTSDGGVGMLRALGASFTTRSATVPVGARALAEIVAGDLSRVQRQLAGIRVRCATDVTNSLLGPTGSAAVFGPQKGAAAAEIAAIDDGLRHLAAVLAADEHAAAPGSGAAGGLGFAAMAGFGATTVSGAEFVADATGLLDRIPTAGAVVIGEGRLDQQTLHGKGPGYIAERARRCGVPCYAIAGQLGLDGRALQAIGVRSAVALVDLAPTVDDAIRHPIPYLRRGAEVLATGEITPVGDVLAG